MNTTQPESLLKVTLMLGDQPLKKDSEPVPFRIKKQQFDIVTKQDINEAVCN